MNKNPNIVTPEFMIRKIDRMIESGDFVWAEETLFGIRETIEKKKKATSKQITAIQNIARAVQ